MSSKQSILLHIEGADAFKEKNYLLATQIFQTIDNPSSAINFDIGCCQLNLKKYELAEASFHRCTAKDKYNSAAFFQLGVVQCLLGKFAHAGKSFGECLTAMRGNQMIDFKQLNLKARIYSCEVKFNLGLLYLFSGDTSKAADYFKEAGQLQKESNYHCTRISSATKASKSRNWKHFGDSITEHIIRLPETAIYTPSKSKAEGVKAEMAIKKATAEVVSAANDLYDYTGFVGAEKLKRETEAIEEESKQASQRPPRPLRPPSRPRPKNQSKQNHSIPPKPNRPPPSFKSPSGPPPSRPPPRLPQKTTSQPGPALPPKTKSYGKNYL